MKLYLLTQSVNRGLDTYYSAVVAAPSAKVARTIHPDGRSWNFIYRIATWCPKPEQVTAKYTGTAAKGTKQGVICAAYIHS